MSDETKHSPEPWHAYEYSAADWDISAEDSEEAVLAAGASKENARRIVACVNACAGLPTAALEAGALAKALDDLAYFVRINGGGECAPGIEGHNSPCGCDLKHAEFFVVAALRALGRLP